MNSSVMILSLQQAIDNLYIVFNNANQPTAIEACSCCISDEEINALLSKKLRNIESCDLKNYTECVFVGVGELNDFKYFLPRILEILANHVDWWNGVLTDSGLHNYFTKPELFFSKLKVLAEWKDWPERERQAIIYFLDSMLDELLQRDKDAGWEIDSCICSLSLCIDDVSPYLQRLVEPQNRRKAREFYLVHRESLEGMKPLGYWWDEVEDKQQEIVVHWFLSEYVENIIFD